VPEIHRQPPEDFTPGAWRFGLHNRENLDTNGSEALKISYANAIGLVGDDLEKFCNAVVDDPKSLLRCYGLQEEATSWSDEVVKYVLSLDALFLALEYDWRMPDEYLWTSEQMTSIEEDVLFQSRNTSWVESNVMDHDICKFENQIPFELIQRACTYLRKLKLGSAVTSDESNEAEVWEKQWKATAVSDGIDSFINVPDSLKVDDQLGSSQHILGFAYEVVCGGLQRTSDASQSYYIHVPSARRLRDSGIKIVGVVGALCTMSYNKETRCLTLPKMKIFDQTVPFVRNMARYEEYSDDDKCMFHDYVLFMLDLIETPEDLRFLTDCDVIHNECGVRGFEMWTGLEQGITAVPSSKEHNEMKGAINRRCKLRQHRFWSELRTLFLSRPWYTLFALAVALITVGTLIQTYAAVIGSDGMKTKFRP
jgi:hypothetical protein